MARVSWQAPTEALPSPVQDPSLTGLRQESARVRDAETRSRGSKVMTAHLVDGDGQVGGRGPADVVGAAAC